MAIIKVVGKEAVGYDKKLLYPSNSLCRVADTYENYLKSREDLSEGQIVIVEDFTVKKDISTEGKINELQDNRKLGYRQIANYGVYPCYINNLSDGIESNVTYKFPYTAAADCSDIKVGYPNFTVPNNSEIKDVLNPDDITVKASFEFSDGTILPFSWNGGNGTITIHGSSFPIAEPIPIELKKGTPFYIRSNANVESGKKWPLGLVAQTAKGGGKATGDLTAGGVINPSSVYAFHPFVIVGKTKSNAFGILGDSVANGGKDVNGVDNGFFRRSFGANIPWVDISRSSDSLLAINKGINRQCRFKALEYCTDVVIEIGINDIRSNYTFDQLKSALFTLWNSLVSRGLRVHMCTILPNTNSTDGWKSTGNQTPYNASQNNVRTMANDLIRSCPEPLTSYIETADVVETKRNSGLWVPDTTGDGLHPNPYGNLILTEPIKNSRYLVA